MSNTPEYTYDELLAKYEKLSDDYLMLAQNHNVDENEAYAEELQSDVIVLFKGLQAVVSIFEDKGEGSAKDMHAAAVEAIAAYRSN